MRVSPRDSAAVLLAVILQFLMEVTLGRLLVAPNVLVPLLVYLAMNRDTAWGIQGAFFAGLCIDLLTSHTPGTSSLSMILGILAAQGLLSTTTAMGGISFYAHAGLASVFSDVLFMLFASRPPGAYLGTRVLLVVPRALVPIVAVVLLQAFVLRLRSRAA